MPPADIGVSFVRADLGGARRVVFQAPALAQRAVAYFHDLQPQAQSGRLMSQTPDNKGRAVRLPPVRLRAMASVRLDQ
ncbi:hypothetical protein [Rhizobium giardinii]|uniref:hypothetical protein n=1 Tax=Rhizobium giardinii TaxID=56731 RepID=UPI003D6E1A31